MRFLLSLFLSVSLFFTSATAVYAMGESRMMQATLVGKSAPDFTLDTLTQKNVNMTKYRDGKRAIIFFWATWCPHCREQLKELNEMRDAIKAKGIKIILVDLGEEILEVQKYAERYKVDLDIFLDKDSALGESYRIIGVPTFYFVDEKGLVKQVTHGLSEDIEQFFTP